MVDPDGVVLRDGRCLTGGDARIAMALAAYRLLLKAESQVGVARQRFFARLERLTPEERSIYDNLPADDRTYG